MTRYTFFLGVVLASTLFAGCAKVPDTLHSPTVKISIDIVDNKEVYTLKFTGGIKNENSGYVLKNIRGTVVFKEAEKSSGLFSRIKKLVPFIGQPGVSAIPFEIGIIPPFEMGIIDFEKGFTEKEIIPLADLLMINRDDLVKNRVADDVNVDNKNLSLSIDSFSKVNILNLLKEKVHEQKK
jgi:hypothetical protein